MKALGCYSAMLVCHESHVNEVRKIQMSRKIDTLSRFEGKVVTGGKAKIAWREVNIDYRSPLCGESCK